MRSVIFAAVVLFCCATRPLLAQGELGAALNVFAYSYDVTVKINGQQITSITGGKSQGTRLFAAGDPMKSKASPKLQSNFVLKDGENDIDIAWKVQKDAAPESIEVMLQAQGYAIPVLRYESRGKREGRAKGVFVLKTKMPDGYKTATPAEY